MRARLAAAPAVLAAIGVLTCACTTQSGPAAPQAAGTVTVHPARVVTAGTSGQPAAVRASAPAGQPPPAPCLTRYPGAKAGVPQGAAGRTHAVLVFTSLSNYPCTLHGYPGVALDAGVPVTPAGLAPAEDPATPGELVTPGPHGTAGALLQIRHAGDYPPASCNPAATQRLQVIPPDQMVPAYLGCTSQTCARPVQILTAGAVRPGSGSA